MSGRLIVALDLDSAVAARAMVERIGDAVSFYKIGFQLALSGGLDLARELKRDGKSVFLDMKLLDIDNTVAKAVEAAAAIGVDMLTVHAYPQAMRAAVRAAAGSPLTLLAVTVLTSLDDGDLAEAGYARTAADLVALRIRQAAETGMGGVVCSPLEAAAARRALGPRRAVVTPGVRPAASLKGGQKRIATPAEAIRAGASHLVVGRPVTAEADPAAAARAIAAEIAAA
jgi:orotidine-5'-phosphate decarboxylase